ncbi:hypothetical protein DFS34DRAFT_661619 [Phlyctochytrium arcticum]|nr:hypothetical protein DFS34DRAFT_661619 [Phlyctochytrium arcticum]
MVILVGNMALTQFLNKEAKSFKSDSKRVSQYEEKGIFNKNIFFEIDEVKSRIQELHGGNLAKKSLADYLGLVRRILNKAGCQHWDIQEEEFKKLVKRYDVSIHELRNSTPRYNGLPQPSDTINYEEVVKQMLEKYESVEYVYDKHEPSLEQIDELQTVIIGLVPVLFFNTRANYMTWKNFCHKNVSHLKDNVLTADNCGNVTLLWNERKQDRINSTKRKRDESVAEDEVIDTKSFSQAMGKVPYDSIKGVNPVKMARILSKFFWRFRKNSEYIFVDKEGNPFKEDSFRKRIISATGHGIAELRRGQITYIHKEPLNNEVREYLSLQNHHSKEENELYNRPTL